MLGGRILNLLCILCLFAAKYNAELLRDSNCAKIAPLARDGKKGKKLL